MRDRQRARHLLTLAPLIAALLAGCALPVLAPVETREPFAAGALPGLTPSASAAPMRALSIERWWTVFDDPALERLIGEALQHNHDLAAAAARLQEARARLDEVGGSRTPQIELQTQSGRSRQSGDGALPPGADRTASNHKLSLAGHYDVDLWGRLAAGDAAARQRLQAQAWARAGVEWGLTAQLAETHFTLRAVQRQTEIGQAMRDSRSATLQLRRREQAAGLGNEFDLRRAEAELAGTEATLTTLQRQRTSLEGTLAVLSGRPLAGVTSAEAAREPLDPARPFSAQLPQGDAGELLLRRPDIRQAEANLAAAQADVTAARAATLPTINLLGMVGSDVRSISNLLNAPGFVWSVASQATAAVVDGGQARARSRQADARANAALANYRQVVLAALVELRDAYAQLDLTLQAQHNEQDRVAALDRARRLAQAGYAAGAFPYLDLLDAERNAFQAQLSEVDAYRDRLIGQVAAFKALGGGFSAPTAIAQK